MPEVPSFVPAQAQQPSLYSRFIRASGLDYETPRGLVADVRESGKFFGDVRKAFSSILSWGNTKR